MDESLVRRLIPFFLPAGGYRYSNVGTLVDAGSWGGYWSSTPHESLDTYAYYFFIFGFLSGNAGVSKNSHRSGFSVRAVAE